MIVTICTILACRAGLCAEEGAEAGGAVRAGHPEGPPWLLPWPGELCRRLHGPLLPRAGQGQRPHCQRHQVASQLLRASTSNTALLYNGSGGACQEEGVNE